MICPAFLLSAHPCCMTFLSSRDKQVPITHTGGPLASSQPGLTRFAISGFINLKVTRDSVTVKNTKVIVTKWGDHGHGC
jgi:hypothetical protein